MIDRWRSFLGVQSFLLEIIWDQLSLSSDRSIIQCSVSDVNGLLAITRPTPNRYRCFKRGVGGWGKIEEYVLLIWF